MDDLQRVFAKSPKLVKDSLDPAIKKAIISVQGASTKHIPVDRGFLRGANATTFSTLKGVLKNTAPYATPVHEGSKPHFPPLSALEGWSRRHGIAPFLVARAISKKGTKGIPFYDMGIKDTKEVLDKIFSDALTDLTNKLAQ